MQCHCFVGGGECDSWICVFVIRLKVDIPYCMTRIGLQVVYHDVGKGDAIEISGRVCSVLQFLFGTVVRYMSQLAKGEQWDGRRCLLVPQLVWRVLRRCVIRKVVLKCNIADCVLPVGVVELCMVKSCSRCGEKRPVESLSYRVLLRLVRRRMVILYPNVAV